MKTAIVVSGHTMGLGVIRGLGKANVPVVLLYYSETDPGISSRYVQQSYHVPHPEKEEKCFVDALIDIVEKYPDSIVFPVSDASLAAVSRNKKEIETHDCVAACPDWSVTQLFLDKLYTYQLAIDAGVPVPRTEVLESVEDAEKYGHDMVYPCIVKPRQSHLFYAEFGTKMFIVHSYEEMVTQLERALKAGTGVMLQEIVTGPDSNGANYNSYHYAGKALVEFTAKKVRSGPPGFGSPRVLITQDIPELSEPGQSILNAMHFQGFQCMEFKKDERDGVYKLIEVNGRHNLSSMLAVETGINFPLIEYRHLAYGEIPEPADFDKGIYWIDFFRDLGYSLRHFRKERYSLWYYLKPYVNRKVFAIISLRDMKPFFARITGFLRKTFKGVPMFTLLYGYAELTEVVQAVTII